MSENYSKLNKLKLPLKTEKILYEFILKVREEFDEKAIVYLIGSYARGDWLLNSDLDLIIISEKFRNLSLGKRYALIRKLLPQDISVELLLYTPEEFKKLKEKSMILQDVRKYWIKLL